MESLSSGDPAAEALPPCETPAAEMTSCGDVETDSSGLGADYWRREVAARLQRYRSRRRPRAPRYPSLRLPFDSPELRSAASGHSAPAAPAVAPLASALSAQNAALQLHDAHVSQSAALTEVSALPKQELDLYSNIIEFPRSAAIPVFQTDELAEPVWDRPRIVEAPEVVPPPPALGGILMEPAAQKEPGKRTDDLSLHSASLPRRILAGTVDALILAVALAGFAAIFLRFNSQPGPIPLLIGGFAIVAALVWAAYEFLFTVCTGSTPGLRMVRLRLAKFDGSPLPRRLRRWRVLASYLSALSLGLGYLWSVLDEDGLCWHDRITRTHVR